MFPLTLRMVVLLALGLCLGQHLAAQCVSGDCKDGAGVFIYPSGTKYVGHFKGGEINGMGTCFYTNGSKYQGEWQRGRPHGRGVRTSATGAKEKGEWEKGQLVRPFSDTQLAETTGRGSAATASQTGCISGDCYSGKGIFIDQGGAVYIGEFKNAEIHGVGVCYYTDGSKYEGTWAHRYPEGQGTKTYPDGSQRAGLWRSGQPVDGEGQVIDGAALKKELQSQGTAAQSGCLSGDCQGGSGIMAYLDGSRYEGRFAAGKPHGRGAFFYPNGERYEGEFINGLRHGLGRLQHNNGRAKEGRWQEGDFLGGIQDTPAPAAGCLAGDCANGSGMYLFRDGAKYTGAFKNNMPHGDGTVIYPNGETYQGQMATATFNGHGTLTMADGTRVIGFWRDGVYLGSGSPELASSSPKYQQAPRVKVWAVIVGVSTYNHMPVLRYPDDDAYHFYAFLKSPEGGALPDEQLHILINEDATKQNIKQTMETVFARAGREDLVLLYFSGHGLKGAFLPIDFDGVDNKLYHDEINYIIGQSRAKFKLCIADACHSGSLMAMRDGREPSILNKYYESLATAHSGTALIMSSKSDETSLESSGLRQGVFSHFLIRGLKGEADTNNNGIVTVQELFDYVHINVRAYTGGMQTPTVQGDYDRNMTVSVKRE